MKTKCAPCDEIVFHVSDPLLPLKYSGRFDEYYIIRGGSSLQVLRFCPFCGGRLPNSRRDQFFDELEQLGIEFSLGDDEAILPDKYKYSNWWEK